MAALRQSLQITVIGKMLQPPARRIALTPAEAFPKRPSVSAVAASVTEIAKLRVRHANESDRAYEIVTGEKIVADQNSS